MQSLCMSISPQAVDRTLRRINSRWTLQGRQPLSRRAALLHVSSGEQSTAPLVLLSHGDADRRRNPDIARDEYRLLETLRAAGLPVAQALCLEREHEPPFLITSLVPGAARCAASDQSELCRKLAETLSAVHKIDLDHHNLSYLPRQTDLLAALLEDEMSGDARLRSAIRLARGGIRMNTAVLLHGDFWLGNLLWEGKQPSGILDWEDAMLGDPLADLGKSRLEMLWALGEAAKETYTAEYLSLNSRLETSALPFWDLWGAARLSHFATFAGKVGKVETMQSQYHGFVDAALDALQK